MTTYERIASARSPFDRYLAGEPLPKLAQDPEVCIFCGHEWKRHGTVKTFVNGTMVCGAFVRSRDGQGGYYSHMCHCERNRSEENKP